MRDQIKGSSEAMMESFAAKVRFGGGLQFDPLLEGKGGWIAGEAQRHDVETKSWRRQETKSLMAIQIRLEAKVVRSFPHTQKEVLVGSQYGGMPIIKFKVNSEKFACAHCIVKGSTIDRIICGPQA